ncbi:MAG TPA: DUF1638 domain-containing protein [Candidatus Eubacterium avistercoris]|uniref:DUF1638 domain-containing protein n=1 Tax=Candidatus Eubacterium avistercoris TaxID=2838567 RepID=A0A9D2D0U8_9FIRM|nr:DUF1638 domain-containing protein [Candidatus Eubacterium avistercoris]
MSERKRTVISCAMLEDELNTLYKKLDCRYPIVWLDRGYHNTPEKLRQKLQDTILSLQDQDELLLTFGLCGNGTAGICSPHTGLILPKFDDCLNMLLCTGRRSCRALTHAGTIYLTRGWTLDRESIVQQYEDLCEKYDEETCEMIMETMYAHYDSLTLIDTGCYNMEEVQAYADEVRKLMDFEIRKTPGSLKILEQLLTGRWDENFLVLSPGQPVLEEYFEVSDAGS